VFTLVMSINLMAQLNEFRGIVPLHSIGVDVEKRLGLPPSLREDWFNVLNRHFTVHSLACPSYLIKRAPTPV
jgi:hypothetical protein